jgi:hypothetical protein
MADRITVTHVRKAAERLGELLAAKVGGQYHLEEWAPGDGCRRFKVVQIMPNTAERDILGAHWFMGAQEAYDGIWRAIYLIEHLDNSARILASYK